MKKTSQQMIQTEFYSNTMNILRSKPVLKLLKRKKQTKRKIKMIKTIVLQTFLLKKIQEAEYRLL